MDTLYAEYYSQYNGKSDLRKTDLYTTCGGVEGSIYEKCKFYSKHPERKCFHLRFFGNQKDEPLNLCDKRE